MNLNIKTKTNQYKNVKSKGNDNVASKRWSQFLGPYLYKLHQSSFFFLDSKIKMPNYISHCSFYKTPKIENKNNFLSSIL